MTSDEAAYKEGNLIPLPPVGSLAGQVYDLLTVSRLFAFETNGSSSMCTHVIAHGLDLPLLFFAGNSKVAKMLPLACDARLAALREAAQSAGLQLSQGGTCVRRPPLPEAKVGVAPTPHVGEGELVALRIPATPGALPAVVALPRRIDYLNAIADALGAPTVCPYSPRAKGGQRFEQPLLYVGVLSGGGEDTRPLNAIASAACGTPVRGDALLTSAEFRESEGHEGELVCQEECGLAALAAAVVERSGRDHVTRCDHVTAYHPYAHMATGKRMALPHSRAMVHQPYGHVTT